MSSNCCNCCRWDTVQIVPADLYAVSRPHPPLPSAQPMLAPAASAAPRGVDQAIQEFTQINFEENARSSLQETAHLYSRKTRLTLSKTSQPQLEEETSEQDTSDQTPRASGVLSRLEQVRLRESKEVSHEDFQTVRDRLPIIVEQLRANQITNTKQLCIQDLPYKRVAMKVSRLGSGTFGTVVGISVIYNNSAATQRTIACKITLTDKTKSDERIQLQANKSLTTEASMLKFINDKCAAHEILPIGIQKPVGTPARLGTEHFYYFAEPFEGTLNSKKFLKKTFNEKILAFKDLFIGLHTLHNIVGVVHHDIKPSNICIDEGLRFADFGGAQKIRNITSRNALGSFTRYYTCPKDLDQYNHFKRPQPRACWEESGGGFGDLRQMSAAHVDEGLIDLCKKHDVYSLGLSLLSILEPINMKEIATAQGIPNHDQIMTILRNNILNQNQGLAQLLAWMLEPNYRNRLSSQEALEHYNRICKALKKHAQRASVVRSASSSSSRSLLKTSV